MKKIMIGLIAITALVSALPAYALGDNEKDALKILAGSALIYSAIKDDQNHTRIDLHSYRGSYNNRHNNRHYESAYDNYGYRSDSRRRRESSCRWTTLNTKIYDRYGHLQEVRRTKVCR
jgi:hypothetical protein